MSIIHNNVNVISNFIYNLLIFEIKYEINLKMKKYFFNQYVIVNFWVVLNVQIIKHVLIAMGVII